MYIKKKKIAKNIYLKNKEALLYLFVQIITKSIKKLCFKINNIKKNRDFSRMLFIATYFY